MALDLKCPSCASDNTQRLSVMHSQQSVKGTIGAGQTALAASFQKPKQPWASTIGFIIALCSIPIFSAFTQSGSLVPPLGFLLVWLGIRFWLKQGYESSLREWQDKLEQQFICLRCGNIFEPTSTTARLTTEEALRREDQTEWSRYKQLGYAALYGLGAVGLVLYAVNESPSNKKQSTLTESRAVSNSQPKTAPSPSSGGDALQAFIQKYGKPDVDDSTQYDNPRPPIVTRWLIYKAAGVRVWFVPDAPISTPPPYERWELTILQDETTQKAITAKEVERRLLQRK